MGFGEIGEGPRDQVAVGVAEEFNQGRGVGRRAGGFALSAGDRGRAEVVGARGADDGQQPGLGIAAAVGVQAPPSFEAGVLNDIFGVGAEEPGGEGVRGVEVGQDDGLEQRMAVVHEPHLRGLRGGGWADASRGHGVGSKERKSAPWVRRPPK